MSSSDALVELLDSAKRGFVPMRNDLVQHPPTAPERAAALSKLVSGRYERSVDALLVLHATWPVLANDPIPLAAWAHLLSTRKKCGPTTASKSFGVLEDLKLITRRREGRKLVVTPLHESGDGREWTRPRSRSSDTGGFFVIPHQYWTDGYADRLRLPGKTMLLIMLKETQGTPVFTMPVERAPAWYGISERTAERGYAELLDQGLIQTHIQKVPSARLGPGVYRKIYHRALRGPFATDSRKQLQDATAARTRAQQSKGSS